MINELRGGNKLQEKVKQPSDLLSATIRQKKCKKYKNT